MLRLFFYACPTYGAFQLRREPSMLVLSRKVGETLVIDGNVRLTVVRVSGNRVAIGIEAPDDVRILRGELNPFGDDSPAGPPVGSPCPV